MGKGSKERRIALGQNCLRNLSYYLDKHRPDEEELADRGSAGEDHPQQLWHALNPGYAMRRTRN